MSLSLRGMSETNDVAISLLEKYYGIASRPLKLWRADASLAMTSDLQ